MIENIKAILLSVVLVNAIIASFTYVFVLMWIARLAERIDKLEKK